MSWQFLDGDNYLAMTIRGVGWAIICIDLKQVFGEKQPLIAVTGAGCIPYWSQLPCLDMLGLNDRYLAHHPPVDLGEGLIGHELGDGDYVLRRKPDIMLFDLGGTETPTFVTGRELSDMPEFTREYAQIVMVAAERIEGSREPPTSFLWLRRDSENIGIRRTPESITIPAYFFNANKATKAFPHGRRLAITVESRHPAEIFLDHVHADGYTLEVHGNDPSAIQCHVEAKSDSARSD